MMAGDSKPSVGRFGGMCPTRAWIDPVRLLLLFALCSGCASFDAMNQPLAQVDPAHGYRPTNPSQYREVGRIWLALAFSGGGTRAASFAYGVLEELRDTQVVSAGRNERLLDEVDSISGVSGGSFPAAYYGLFGDRIFEDFEDRFLRKDIQDALVWRVLAPWNLFRMPGPNMSRTHIARDYYDKHVFDYATFADLGKAKGPRIHVNATDLIQGNRFTYDQNTFDIICSDLDPFPISAATASSSAVPGLLSPLTLRNYAGQCGFEPPAWFDEALENRRTNPRGAHTARQFGSYLDAQEKQYIHLVDGGVADNLGMSVHLERLAESGGIDGYREQMGVLAMPDHVVVILVDAETEPNPALNMTAVAPNFTATMGLVSGVQIRRSNFETLELSQQTIRALGEALSEEGHPVTAHLVEVGFDLSDSEEERKYLKHLPTSFKLSDEQVDRLIAAGRKILRESPDYQELLGLLTLSAVVLRRCDVILEASKNVRGRRAGCVRSCGIGRLRRSCCSFS